jgi:glucose/mannose transport system permease protein
LHLLRQPSRLIAIGAVIPAAFVFIAVFVGGMAWSVYISLTSSKLLPNYSSFVGFRQYTLLFHNGRWDQAMWNLFVYYGPLVVVISIGLGTLLAILIDQRVRVEGGLRSLYLLPYSMSFIVTGLLWRWVLDPSYGIQQVLNLLGISAFKADWLVQEKSVIYALVAAGVWHSSGLVMAIMLAALRGVDEDIWKAIKVEGIPAWRAYISIVLPMLNAAVATAVVLLSISVVKVYDLIIAMTHGGPGFASDMPATVVMDNFFERQNIGLATAGTTVMLTTVIAILAPWMFVQSFRNRQQRRRAG